MIQGKQFETEIKKKKKTPKTQIIKTASLRLGEEKNQ